MQWNNSMFNKESQYVNIVQYNNQIKINYRKFDETKPLLNQDSTFVSYDKILPQDIGVKINDWKEHNYKTYLTSICIDKQEHLFPKHEAKKYSKDYVVASLNQKYSTVVKKSCIDETKLFFNQTGIDYVFTPFQVLNLYLELNPSKNSLLLFTINNLAYILITGFRSEIIDYKIVELSTFEQIQQTQFYDNEVVGQKLFDEIYYLQIQEAIKGAVEDFYHLQNENFVEKINVLYTQKQLNDEQIQSLNEELLLDINYYNISVKEALFQLTKQDKLNKKSLIRANKKRSKWFFKLIFVGLFLFTALGLGTYFYQEELKTFYNDFVKERELEKSTDSKIDKQKMALLPNHVLKNEKIKSEIVQIFNVVPVDALLKKIMISYGESDMNLTLLSESTYVKAIQPKLLELYSNSNVKIQATKLLTYDVNIHNSEKKKLNIKKINDREYVKHEKFSTEIFSTYLRSILPKESVFRYRSSFKSEVLTYNYNVVTVFNEPKDFYTFLEQLNTKKYSINISYPVSFEKVNDGLEVAFVLQFHQSK